ncbi:MAG TPA: hypothetical protein VGD37_33280 [Kofleriaceae bacterium]
MVGPAIVELARAAVRRLIDAAPAAAQAREALARIERVGLGPPYTVVVAGESAARTELLNWLAGERLFDPARRDRGRIVLSLRRGPTTSLRARRRDGSVEDRPLAAEPPADAVVDPVPAPAPPGGPRAFRRATRGGDRAETLPASDLPAFRDAVVLSAEAETTAMVQRPPWWAVWRWLALWLAAWLARRRTPALPAAVTPASAADATTPARRALANTVARDRHPGDPRRQFIDALTGCLADDTVERLFVEVGGGPLSEKVVVIELPAGANAGLLDAAGADACLVACGERGFAITEQLDTMLCVVPHLFAVGGGELAAGTDPRVRRLASFAAAAEAMVQLATIERALAVGAHAVASLAAGSAALDAAITRAEIEFRARIDRLEALRIASPDDHIAAALARIRPAVVEHVRRLLRGALDQLDDAVTALGATWAARLGEASSADALRTAATRINDESPAVLQDAQAAAHRVLVDGLTERARVHYHELVGELRHGAARRDAAPSWLTVEIEIAALTSSTSLGAVAPRLTSLFRSFDALRTDALAQLEQRVAKLRQVASANLLDTEPRLEPSVTGPIAIALRGEVERHAAWLEAELARERVAIDAERTELASFAILRDDARSDERKLVTALDALAAELP